MSESHQQLINLPLHKIFLKFFVPAIMGLMLMSVNILMDGLFVGNGVGAESLAAVNLSYPIISLILAIALWIGIGGAALYSMLMGEHQPKKASSVFSMAVAATLIVGLFVGVFGTLNIETIADLLGANADTYSYVIDYLRIILLFGWGLALVEVISTFVRNDGSPMLSMLSLGTTAVVNIILNYFTIFVWGMGVKGAAISTVVGGFAGLLVVFLHFFNRKAQLRKIVFQWSWNTLKKIFSIGFPSFLAEAGFLVFVVGYNLSIVDLAGTAGVAAFSVINYLHGFMFLAFFGIEMALQPMISFFHGAGEKEKIKGSVKIGEKTAFVLGVLLLGIGSTAASFLVSLFGIESTEIQQLAVEGIRMFFIAYLFLGYNFVYMSYFQSIGQIRPAIIIILLRSFVFLLILLWILPKFIGVPGIWLSLPLSEFLVTILLIFIVRKRVVGWTKALARS